MVDVNWRLFIFSLLNFSLHNSASLVFPFEEKIANTFLN